MRYNVYITFHSIHDVLALERALKSAKGTDLQFEVVPTPRAISRSCGSCIKTDEKSKEVILDIAQKNGISTQGVFLMEDKFS